MRIWHLVRRFRPRMLRRAPHYLGRLVAELRHDQRVEQSKHADPILSFWRSHGLDWGREEANPDDLGYLGRLAMELEPLSREQAEITVVRELKSAWATGFANPADALGWDDMNDRLPASALVAFVEGAGEAWKLSRQAL